MPSCTAIRYRDLNGPLAYRSRQTLLSPLFRIYKEKPRVDYESTIVVLRSMIAGPPSSSALTGLKLASLNHIITALLLVLAFLFPQKLTSSPFESAQHQILLNRPKTKSKATGAPCAPQLSITLFVSSRPRSPALAGRRGHHPLVICKVSIRVRNV